MANRIIQNRVKDELKIQGRTRVWFLAELEKNGITFSREQLGFVLNNTRRSIKLHELITIARILDIKPFDLLVHQDGKVVYLDGKLKGVKHVERKL